MTARGGVFAGTALALALVLAPAALAQTATGAAPTREEINRAAPPPQATPPSRLTVDDRTTRAPCPLAGAGGTIALTLHGARFDHLQGLPPEDLRPAYEAYLGKPIDGAALCAIRDAATAILTRAGYVAAIAIPPQPIEAGDIRFDVVMARLIRVELAGGGRASARLAAYLAKIAAQPLFNVRTAERYLLLARDLPGYDVHLILRSADSTPGEVIGIVSVTRTRIALSANLQNYGSHDLGRWGALVSAQANDVLGLGDRLTLGLFNSLQVHEQTVAEAGYDLRLGGEGAAFGTRVTYALTRPSIDNEPLSSRTLVAALEAGYPLIRRQAVTLRAAAGLELIDQDLRLAGFRVTRDRLRTAFLRLDLEARGMGKEDLFALPTAPPAWRLGGTLELRHGLGILGASHDCGAAATFAQCFPTLSNREADPQATLVRLTGYGEARPLRRLTLVVSPRFQYAFDPLASYEQYSGGAYTIGRGYDPGAAIGDSGVGVSLEAQYGAVTPRRRGFGFQPFVFVDGVWVWNRATIVPEDDPLRLLSAGGGVRIAVRDRARIELTGATPLRRGPYQLRRGDTRLLVSVTTRLLP